MTNTTTDVSETRRRHRAIMIWGVALSTWLIGLSLLLHFVGLGVAWQTGFLTNRMVFDKQQTQWGHWRGVSCLGVGQQIRHDGIIGDLVKTSQKNIHAGNPMDH